MVINLIRQLCCYSWKTECFPSQDLLIYFTGKEFKRKKFSHILLQLCHWPSLIFEWSLNTFLSFEILAFKRTEFYLLQITSFFCWEVTFWKKCCLWVGWVISLWLGWVISLRLGVDDNMGKSLAYGAWVKMCRFNLFSFKCIWQWYEHHNFEKMFPAMVEYIRRKFNKYSRETLSLKACVHYFLSNFYFSLNDSPSKTMKNVFYLI